MEIIANHFGINSYTYFHSGLPIVSLLDENAQFKRLAKGYSDVHHYCSYNIKIFIILILVSLDNLTEKISKSVHDDLNRNHSILQVFSLQEIKLASNGFSDENKLGEGGYGPVYRVKVLFYFFLLGVYIYFQTYIYFCFLFFFLTRVYCQMDGRLL